MTTRQKTRNKFYESWKLSLFTVGFILTLIASIYLFTRPAIFDEFDLTKTGTIGDTIGGITAPIINIIGSILIYVSFQAQIRANKIQFRLLNREFENQGYDRSFQVTLDLFKELKSDFNILIYDKFTGQAAMNSFVNGIDSTWNKEEFEDHCGYPIFGHFKFIISEYDLLITQISGVDIRPAEKERISILLYNYYITQLEYSTNKIVEYLEKFELQMELVEMVNNFRKVHEKMKVE